MIIRAIDLNSLDHAGEQMAGKFVVAESVGFEDV